MYALHLKVMHTPLTLLPRFTQHYTKARHFTRLWEGQKLRAFLGIAAYHIFSF